eukprot:Amastigsp_a513888_31.p3 type:complete len:173 gc:universal Amastigsp_a513888_31:900-382(-)
MGARLARDQRERRLVAVLRKDPERVISAAREDASCEPVPMDRVDLAAVRPSNDRNSIVAKARRVLASPDAKRAVGRRRHKALSGGGERGVPHGGLVPDKRVHALPVPIKLGPDLERVVVRRRDNKVLCGMPRHSLDVLRVAVKHTSARVLAVLGAVPDPYRLVARARCEKLA